MPKHGPAQREGAPTRVLVAMGDEYRAYREVIAAGLEIMRPGLEVVSAGTGALDGEELGRLDPGVVVCHRPAPPQAGGWLAWVRLPLNPTRPMEVSLHGHRRPAATGHTLGALLAVIDEAERLSRSEHHPGDPPPG